MRLLILATAVLLLLQVSAAGATRTEALIGEWTPIKDLSDPYVREIAEFAVKSHNDQAKTGLVLKKVVRGDTRVVSGVKYRLVIEVKDGANTKSYDVVVLDKPQEHFRNLQWFDLVPGNL